MRCRLLLVLLMGLAFLLPAAAQRPVTVWTYHVTPPFIVDRDSNAGLSSDLVALLNRHADNAGRFQFTLSVLPRRRLDLELQQGAAGMVLWVVPAFFDRADVTRVSWTRPLLQDQQDFVSRSARPFEYQGLESLRGRLLGTVLGHRYGPIQAEMEQGTVLREDVPSDEQNLRKLLAGRVDQILIARSTTLYFVRQMKLEGRLHVSSVPLQRYARQVLLSSSLDPAAAAFVERVVAGLDRDPEWRRLLAKYALE